VTEDDFCAPRDHVLNYSLSKLLNEHLARSYEERTGVSFVSLRAPVVFGAGRKRGTTVWASEFATGPALGRAVTLPFPPDDRNCYIYVEDLAEQIARLCVKPSLAHRLYNSGGHTVRAAELADLVRRVVPAAGISFNDQAPPSPFINRMDDRRIRAEIDFTLRPMEEAVRAHVERVRRDHER